MYADSIASVLDSMVGPSNYVPKIVHNVSSNEAI